MRKLPRARRRPKARLRYWSILASTALMEPYDVIQVQQHRSEYIIRVNRVDEHNFSIVLTPAQAREMVAIIDQICAGVVISFDLSPLVALEMEHTA